MIYQTDLIVLGAGPGGLEAAAEAARMGLHVTLIERGEIGGTCLNRGCIPTKSLVAAAETALSAHRAGEFGISVPDVSVDYPAVHARVEAVVERMREGAESLLSKVNVVKGTGRLAATGPSVWVGEDRYNAPRLIIATGSRPALPDIPGADLCLTSDGILAADTLPPSLVIIGGGVIGIEFASVMSALGSQVTVIEYTSEILPGFDRETAKRLRALLTRRGIKILTSASASSVSKAVDGMKTVEYTHKGASKQIVASAVLMAVGRRPVIPEGAETAGIKIDRRGIMTDDNFLSSRENIYAIGDCNGRCLLAHAASAQARKVLGLDVNLSHIPAAVFSHPECAMVGLTEEQCASRELAFRVGRGMFAANGKAVSMGEAEGFVKVIAERDGGQILGAHIVGPHAADLIQELATAMDNFVSVRSVASSIHIHPALGEAVAAACAAASTAP